MKKVRVNKRVCMYVYTNMRYVFPAHQGGPEKRTQHVFVLDDDHDDHVLESTLIGEQHNGRCETRRFVLVYTFFRLIIITICTCTIIDDNNI